jgi:hypothetical protein
MCSGPGFLFGFDVFVNVGLADDNVLVALRLGRHPGRPVFNFFVVVVFVPFAGIRHFVLVLVLVVAVVVVVTGFHSGDVGAVLVVAAIAAAAAFLLSSTL